MVLAKGWKKLGKVMLCKTAPVVVEAGHNDSLDNLRYRAGLPDSDRLHEIDSTKFMPPASTPEPTFFDVFEAVDTNQAFKEAMGVLDHLVHPGEGECETKYGGQHDKNEDDFSYEISTNFDPYSQPRISLPPPYTLD